MKAIIFYSEDRSMELWVSPKNPVDRDFIEIPRFRLIKQTADGKSCVMVTEDFDQIQNYITGE